MKELCDAYTLLSKAAKYSRRAQKASVRFLTYCSCHGIPTLLQPIVDKLSEKARNALILALSFPYELGNQWTVEEDKVDELAIFAGRTKFVFMKRQTTDTAPEGSTKQTYPVPESQQQPGQPQQLPPMQTASQSYNPESSGSAWRRGEQTQAMTSWGSAQYPTYATSQPTSVPLPASFEQVQAQGPSVPDPSTRQPSMSDTSDLYQLNNPPSLSTPLHSQVYHPPTQPHDPLSHVSQALASFAVPPYYDLGSTGAHQHHQHQNSLLSSHEYHQPTQQLPPVALAPPELAQLGLVAQKSRLDQRWTSFMRQTGCFEDFGYKS